MYEHARTHVPARPFPEFVGCAEFPGTLARAYGHLSRCVYGWCVVSDRGDVRNVPKSACLWVDSGHTLIWTNWPRIIRC